jgi:putative hydrolase of the HAD superfamily
MTPITKRQHLIFDADDTLWENNIYFEQAFDEFCEYLNHSSLTPVEIRGILDEIEVANAKIHGYGAVNFGRNLSQCYLRLAERAVDEHDLSG